MRWFWSRTKDREPPLTGAPHTARWKTYSAMSGYAYQYVFAGQRPAGPGTEYAFDVSSDRKTRRRIWVFVADSALTAWMGANDRVLTNSERYGIAKIALRNAMDQRTPPELDGRIAPDAFEVKQILSELDV